MIGRKKINTNHPDYQEAFRKFKDIQNRMENETKTIEYQGGMDGDLGSVHKKYMEELDRLMQEYSYLYTEE